MIDFVCCQVAPYKHHFIYLDIVIALHFVAIAVLIVRLFMKRGRY